MTAWTIELEAALASVSGGKAGSDVESRTLDFKTDAADPKSTGVMLAETAVCFANTLGGVIILGVDDKRRGAEAFVGTRYSPDEVRRLIHERTLPKLTVEARALERHGKSLVAAYVPEGLEVHSTTAGRALERIDRQRCEAMPPARQARLVEERAGYDWSAQESDAGLERVAPLAMAAARQRLAGLTDSRQELARLSDTDLLRALDLVGPSGRLRNAGELLLANPQAGAGPTTLYQYRPTPGGEPTAVDRLDRPMLTAFQRALELVDARRSTVPLNLPDGQQITLADFPDLAVREALANALIHRDHRLSGPVVIEHSRTALVVTSPGPLVAGVTPENILTHVSKPRNPTLAAAFRTLGLAEETGRGVDRMYREMIRSGRDLPEIEDRGDSVRVSFVGGAPNTRIARYVARIGQDEQNDTDTLLVLFVLCARPSVTAASLAPILQKGEDETEAVLRRLSADPPGMTEPTRSTARRSRPTYRLRGPVLSQLGPAVAYRRRLPDEIDRKVVDHVREYGKITNRTVRNLFDVDVQRAKTILSDLVERGVIVKTSDRERGPNIEYGPGPEFPWDRPKPRGSK